MEDNSNDFALPASLLKTAPAKTSSDKGLVLGYVNTLEGYKTKFKNLHWSAGTDPLHKRVDEFLDILSEYQDAVSEDVQGTVGPFSANEVKGTNVTTTDAMSTIKAIWEDTMTFRTKVEGKRDYIGLISVIDDFCHDIKKYIYLFRIC